jgi:thymidylate synthase (FAD)
MDCWRQWIRHRMASVNEYSTRYSVAIEASQRTEPDAWRVQAAGNRQGSQGFLEIEKGEAFSKQEEELQTLSRKIYQERLEAGVAREQARKDLPLSTYTEAYWKADLHNLLHFLALRMDVHAQKEIRDYASVIGNEIVSRWCPMTWEAFQDYYLHTTSLSRLDQAIIAAIGAGKPAEAIHLAQEFGILTLDEKGPTRNRERQELENKLSGLNLPIPWLKPQ